MLGAQSKIKRKKGHLITGYKMQAIEVGGELSDIIDLFVRINSTGKALTSAEKRHAKYYNSEFLRTAGKVADHFTPYFLSNNVLSRGQISRMKHVELICELMISIHNEGVINKKAALDKVMSARSITSKQAQSAKAQCTTALNRIKKIFPKIKTTRFHQLSDYYSLAVLMWKFERDGRILTNNRRNKLAFDLLRNLSDGVDEVRLLQKNAKGTKPGQELYRDYLLTVLQSTDEIKQRQKREDILRGVLENLFENKDVKRIFSKEQRRLMWNSEKEPRCKDCGKTLKWEDFTADHIRPHSKGGRTKMANAALMHRACNSRKSDR